MPRPSCPRTQREVDTARLSAARAYGRDTADGARLELVQVLVARERVEALDDHGHLTVDANRPARTAAK
jgi:hypothetical protein